MGINIKLPTQAELALNLLSANGYEAYVVGGCVRDSIMGKEPKDWDITTCAMPEDIIRVFDGYRVIETGIKHGTVTVVIKGLPLEITTYRVDGEYRDNRRPECVTFVDCISEDLRRRDFTVNAMAYNSSTGLLDCFGGIDDIKLGIIRCVGNPDHRFNEDGLRIMRALRFASVLGFRIEKATSDSIHENCQLLSNISAERISVELNKLLIGSGAVGIIDEYRDVISVFIPEIRDMFDFCQHSIFHPYDLWRHTLLALDAAPAELPLRLTMFLHDIAKPMCFTCGEDGIGHFYMHQKRGAEMASKILHRLKYDNCTIDTVKTLIFYHDADFVPDRSLIKRWLNKMNPQLFAMLLSVKRADIAAQNIGYAQERLAVLDDVEALMNEILQNKECFSLKDLEVNGRDVILAGVPAGKQVGEILNLLMDAVIAGEMKNDRDELMSYINSIRKESLYNSITGVEFNE